MRNENIISSPVLGSCNDVSLFIFEEICRLRLDMAFYIMSIDMEAICTYVSVSLMAVFSGIIGTERERIAVQTHLHVTYKKPTFKVNRRWS
jgi:hypothetical protein